MGGGMDTVYLNRQLEGHTVVLELLFHTDIETGDCTLSIDLAEDNTKGASVRRIRFSGVTNLSLQDFGGDLTQLASLRIEDVSGRQWDRIAYSITELEHESIAFLCRDVSIPARYALGVDTPPGA